MSAAAAISTPLRASSLRSLTSPSLHPLRSSPSSFHLRFQPTTLRRNSNLRISPLNVVTNIAAQEKTPSPIIPLLDPTDNHRVLHFVKYHGLGNDFIMVDNRDSTEPRVTPEQAVQLCDRNFGIGADGVMFVMPGIDGTDYTMRIFNSDGSEPEMCGNGIRCFAKFVADLCNINGKRSFTISTGAGLIVPEIQDDGKVRVDMGEPVLEASKIPTKLAGNVDDSSVVKAKLEVDGVSWIVSCVSMGNPHCVTFGREGDESLVVNELNLADIGPKFEHHLMFPARTNTEFVQVYSRSHLKMRVWERGAGATLACGTGACAVVVAGVLEGRADRNCTVDLPGGPLEIYWDEQNNHVYMTGPAQPVFYGSVLL